MNLLFFIFFETLFDVSGKVNAKPFKFTDIYFDPYNIRQTDWMMSFNSEVFQPHVSTLEAIEGVLNEYNHPKYPSTTGTHKRRLSPSDYRELPPRKNRKIADKESRENTDGGYVEQLEQDGSACICSEHLVSSDSDCEEFSKKCKPLEDTSEEVHHYIFITINL